MQMAALDVVGKSDDSLCIWTWREKGKAAKRILTPIKISSVKTNTCCAKASAEDDAQLQACVSLAQ